MNYYDITILMTIFSLVILLTFILKSNLLVKSVKKGFMLTLLCVSLSSIFEWIGVITDGNIKVKVFHMIAKALELSITPFVPFILGNSLRKTKPKHDVYVMSILFLHALTQFSSIFFNTTFYIDNSGTYHHSDAYFIYYLAIILGITYFAYYMIKLNIDCQGTNNLALFLVILYATAGVIFQIVNPSIKVIWLIVAICLILLFIYYVSIVLRIDDLTGLLNRRVFDVHIESNNKTKGALFFDINKFKQVNDEHGHQYGDAILLKVAKSIKKIYGRYGYCYRVGGDEFCVILNKYVENMEMLKLDFLNDLAKERLNDKNLPGVAVGYAKYNPKAMTIKETIDLADQSMYSDKNKNE